MQIRAPWFEIKLIDPFAIKNIKLNLWPRNVFDYYLYSAQKHIKMYTHMCTIFSAQIIFYINKNFFYLNTFKHSL